MLHEQIPITTSPNSPASPTSPTSPASPAKCCTPESPAGSPQPLEQVKLRVDALHWRNNVGLYLQYFAVGIISSGLPATLYGFFLGYLEVKSYVYATAAQVIALPWSFKILYGALNDCCPIRGYNRKPYMVIGWIICTLALMLLASRDMPEQNDASAAGNFSSLMALAAVGYIMADVAADGLVVELAKLEPHDTRGTLQSNVYTVRTLGSIVAALLVGLGMNGKEYNGEFERTLQFTQVCAILAIPAGAMVLVSAWGVVETRKRRYVTLRSYARECYAMLQNRTVFYVGLYSLMHGTIGDINTTASGNVAKEWAGVHNMQAALFGIVGAAIFALGLYLVKTRLLHVNWRFIIAGTTVLLTAVDSVFTFMTVFGVVRNQYFYLGETVIVMVPAAARFLVTTFVVVELAPDGKEGIMFGLMTTLHNLGGPMAQAISNSVFALFQPSLSNIKNYRADTMAFRTTVAWSYALSYFAGLVALGLLPLLPKQKDDTHRRLQQWDTRKAYAKWTIGMTLFAWIYSTTMNLLAMFPATQCLEFVGGEGC